MEDRRQTDRITTPTRPGLPPLLLFTAYYREALMIGYCILHQQAAATPRTPRRSGHQLTSLC